MAEKNMLKLKSPGTAETSVDLPKVGQNYYGIEFTRNTSNNGGSNGYHKMIGTDEMLAEMPVHNLLRVCAVKDAKITQVLNQTNWYKDEDGNDVDLAGANGEDFMLALTQPVYAIMGGTDATYDRYIVGLEPFSYGGDVAKKIEPFAESVSFSTRIDSKQRCVHDETVAGSMGTQYSCITEGFDEYRSSAAMPRTSTTRFSYELYARNKNEDNTSNLPYCNANTIDMSFWMTMMYIEMRTKILQNVIGYGIKNTPTPTDSNWDDIMYSGFKITEADGTVHYYAMNNTSVYVDTGSGMTNGTGVISFIAGGSYPMWQIMEAAMDVSSGCQNGTFTPMTCPDGTAIKGVDDGVMTGIYCKHVTGKIQCAFESGAEAQECDIDMKLSLPIFHGKDTVAFGVRLYLSGSDILSYVDEEGNVSNILYQAKSIEDITTDTDTESKANKEDWAFVGVYDELGSIGTVSTTRIDLIRSSDGVTHVLGGPTNGGSATTYEGVYNTVYTTTTTQGVYIRRALFVGGYPVSGSTVWRECSAGGAPSYSLTYCGGGFRCKLSQ